MTENVKYFNLINISFNYNFILSRWSPMFLKSMCETLLSADIYIQTQFSGIFMQLVIKKVLDSPDLLIEFPGPHIGRHDGNIFYIYTNFVKKCTFIRIIFFKLFCFDFGYSTPKREDRSKNIQ